MSNREIARHIHDLAQAIGPTHPEIASVLMATAGAARLGDPEMVESLVKTISAWRNGYAIPRVRRLAQHVSEEIDRIGKGEPL